MYQKKEYRTLRTFAQLTAGLGWVVVAVLFIVGFIAGLKAEGLLAGLVAGAIATSAGLGLIVYGQLVSVFLDQKELLEEIAGSSSQGASPTSRTNP